jgi:hypothetical protein
MKKTDSILRNSINVVGDNMGLSAKVFVYSAVLVLVFLFVTSVILQPVYRALTSYDFSIWEELFGSIVSIANGEGGFSTFTEGLRTFFSANTELFWVRGGLLVLVYFFFMLFMNLAKLPVAKILHSKMSQSYNERFYYALFSSLGTSLVYSLIYSLMSVAFDLIVLTLSVLLFVWLNPLIGFFGLTLIAFVALSLLSLKQCIFSQWVPSVVIETKNIFKALRLSFAKSLKNIRHTFVPHFFGATVMFAITATTFIFTFGLLPILLIPIYIIYANTVDVVTYFTINNKKFYTYGTHVEE